MTSIRAFGSLLTANADTRTLTYRLLPYGEEGRTNVGRVTASHGAVTVPVDASQVVLNLEHERTRPVGRAVSIEDVVDGLRATFSIARTRAGDDLLEEAAEGLRAGVSVELDDPVIRAGRLVSGVLSGAGAVVTPAFPSALLVAADAGDLPETPAAGAGDGEEATDVATHTTRASTEANPTVAPNEVVAPSATDGPTETVPVQAPQPGPGATEEPAEGADEEDQPEGTEPTDDNEEEATVPETTMTASAPVGSLASRKTPRTPMVGKGDLFRMLATAHQQGGSSRMLAVLSDIVPGDILGLEQPQYVGELWAGKAYQRRIVPLFNQAQLTSYTVQGWRWVTKPVVAAYAGNKTDVPSNAIETEAVTATAARLAGAHDIDRKFRDFNDTEFFSAYFAAMTESYAKQSDTAVFNAVETAAGAATTVGTVPTDVSLGLTMIVDGALQVLADTRSAPSFALIAPGLYRDILLTRSDDALSLLNASLGLEEGSLSNFRIIPWPDMTAGQVLVGTSDAVTVHELGSVPIRVEAVDLAKGGIDEGVFGYYAVTVHNADGLALIDDGVA